MTQSFIAELIQKWEPPESPHCSKCRRTGVHGEPDDPMVTCKASHGKDTKAHGKELLLTRVIRERLPLGFRSAAECPDYEEYSGC